MARKEWNQKTKYGEKERKYGEERKKQEKGGRGKNNLLASRSFWMFIVEDQVYYQVRNY